MLDSWSISRRVGSGFLILTVMLVGLALFGHRATSAIGNGYSEYRDIARQTVAISAYTEDIFEARVAALQYRISPDATYRQAVIDNLDEVINDVVFIESFEKHPERLAQVEALIGLAREYRLGFLDMSAHLDDANTAKMNIETLSQTIKTDVNEVFRSAIQAGNPSFVSAAGRTLQASTGAILQGKQYIASGLDSDLQTFQSQFSNLERALSQFSAIGAAGALGQQVTALQQTIRSYPDLITEYGSANADATEFQKRVDGQIGAEMDLGFDTIADEILERKLILGAQGASIVAMVQNTMPVIGIISVLAAIVAAIVVGRWITGSVSRLADMTDRLAAGNDDIEIVGAQHDHELGRMARALNVFREAQIERKEASQERAKMRAQQDAVVDTMQRELAHLAQGNLTANITTKFAPEYEDLRVNFNGAVQALHQAVSKVRETATLIGANTTDSNSATSELSQRTENQAATLEQTAAALDELTASVRSAAEHAKAVDTSVIRARSEATKNGEIVAQAVEAMNEIEDSSKQITQVISVIDDIAFQTNLLALNAGVEAARAGESGKGFAVVASEVRALAQRSAEAAKEISELIANSSRHVSKGTQLVGNAGDALSEIIAQVNDISSMTSQIATSAEEQAIGLSEINIGVNQLDQVTQQNAAMVQESMSRGDALVIETGNLDKLIGSFKIGNAAGQTRLAPPASAPLEHAIAQTQANPPEKTAVSASSVAGGAGADTIWEDF